MECTRQLEEPSVTAVLAADVAATRGKRAAVWTPGFARTCVSLDFHTQVAG